MVRIARRRSRLLTFAAASLFAAAAAEAQMSNVTSAPADLGRDVPRAGDDTRHWDADATFLMEYDSNVGLTEDGSSAPLDAEPAFRAGLAGSGSYRLVDSERFQFGAGGSFVQTTTQGSGSADEYELTSLSPRLFAGLDLSAGERPVRVELDYRYRRDWLGGGDFERSHGTRLAAAVGATERLELGAHYSVDLNDFDATGFHAPDSRRDAEHHRVGGDATWRSERMSFALGYEFLRNLAEQRDSDFEAHGFAARWRARLPGRVPIGVDLLASYTDADYVHFTTSPKRDARTQLYRASVLVPLNPKLMSSLSYGFLRVGADQARFRARRHVVSAALAYRF